MNSMKHLITKSFLLVAVLLGASSQAYAMKSPEDVVKETVDTMVSKLQTNRALYTSNTPALYQMLNEVLIPTLHLERMGDLILNKEFARSSSRAQKAAFIEEFKDSLLISYADALLGASGKEKVVYEPVVIKPGADKVKIKAILITESGDQFPIVLSMSNRKDSQWRAYNIEAAGINFISTYRSVFAQTLNEKGIDGLIADLRTKNAK